jgi:hypothetical protein
MPEPVHYLPIITTLVSIPFAVVLFKHWRSKPDALYLFWWFLGVVTYGIGTLTESLTTLLGWQPWIFKSWYISGALLGGAPLAQGSIYLLMKRSVGNVLAVIVVSFIIIASVFVIMSPIDLSLVETYRLSGSVLEWQWVRAFSPFVNTYAAIFLIGGAFWSAWQYRSAGPEYRPRYIGNIFIAVGALLPGIGGTSARMGYVEILYVTELAGLILIWMGYRWIVSSSSSSIYENQQETGQSDGLGSHEIPAQAEMQTEDLTV